MTSSLKEIFFFSKSFFWCKCYGESAFIKKAGGRRRAGEIFFYNKGLGMSIRRDDM